MSRDPRTPEQARIMLLERQVDHILHALFDAQGRMSRDHLYEIQQWYRTERTNVPFATDTDDTGESDDVLRDSLVEAENALDQFILFYEQPGYMSPADTRGAVVHQLAKNARARARHVLGLTAGEPR